MAICKTRKLTIEQVKEIVALYPSIGIEAIAKRFKTSNRTVCDILRCHTYKDIERDPVTIASPLTPLSNEAREAIVTLNKLDKNKYTGLYLAKIFDVHYQTIYRILRKHSR